jgi:hypothetical protein
MERNFHCRFSRVPPSPTSSSSFCLHYQNLICFLALPCHIIILFVIILIMIGEQYMLLKSSLSSFSSLLPLHPTLVQIFFIPPSTQAFPSLCSFLIVRDRILFSYKTIGKINKKQTPWPESVNELYRPREYNWGATWQKSGGSCLENREHGHRDPWSWSRGTLYPQ